MIIISYDISDNKLRTKFAKYISKFGRRMQYSVFEGCTTLESISLNYE